MWWQLLIIGLLFVIGCFGFVLLSGAPYVPTLRRQVKAALDLANLKPGMTIIELGCGDGRILIAAAKQGLRVTGFELNPILFLVSWFRTIHYRAQVRVVWGNFWRRSWPPADAVYVFLLPRLMAKLDQKVKVSKARELKVVSFAFRFPDRKPSAEKDGVFLYEF